MISNIAKILSFIIDIFYTIKKKNQKKKILDEIKKKDDKTTTDNLSDILN